MVKQENTTKKRFVKSFTDPYGQRRYATGKTEQEAIRNRDKKQKEAYKAAAEGKPLPKKTKKAGSDSVASRVDETGHRHYARGKTKGEAEEKLKNKMRQIEKGAVGLSSKMSVQRWSEEWLQTYVRPKVRQPGTKKKKNTMSEACYQMYENKMVYIVDGVGNYRIGRVHPADLQRILNEQSDMSESHLKKIRMVMIAMFAQAKREGLIARNPAEGLQIPATETVPRRSLTDEERRIILEVAETDPHGAWIKFLLWTGLRPGETAPLLVSDIDLKNRYVYVTKAIEGGTYRVIGDPKTAAGTRNIPISDNLYTLLKQHIKGKKPSDYVFTQKDGKTMMTKTVIRKYWLAFLRNVDIAMGAEMNSCGHIYDPEDKNPDGSPMYPDPKNPGKSRNGHKIADDLVLYCLRHTYCTDLQHAGVPINVAKHLMGHSDISTTAKIYTHTGNVEVDMARQKIDSYNSRNQTVEDEEAEDG